MKNAKQFFAVFMMKTLMIFMLVCLPISVAADGHFDSYLKLPWKYEMARLDNFAIYLRQNPERVGYIVFLVGEKDSYKKVKARINRSVKYLIEYHKYDKNKLTVIYAGKLENTMTILQPDDKDGSHLKSDFPDGKIISSDFKVLNE